MRTRVVMDVTLDLPGLDEPGTGRLVSIPEQPHPVLNDLYLRRGRWILPGHPDEVLVSEAFGRANGLEPGDSIPAVLNGRWQRLRIVGLALSPEYIYEIRGLGDVFPDNRHFGVIWMGERALGAAFQMEGAFNDVSIALAPGASEADVIDAADRLLAPYGGTGAFGRADHLSHMFVSSEIDETQITSVLLPSIFLGVTAFLLNMVLARLVATQREQIAVLKAFGYGDAAIAFHYFQLALGPVLAGAAAGTGLGIWLAVALARVYARFYQFPLATLPPGLGRGRRGVPGRRRRGAPGRGRRGAARGAPPSRRGHAARGARGVPGGHRRAPGRPAPGAGRGADRAPQHRAAAPPGPALRHGHRPRHGDRDDRLVHVRRHRRDEADPVRGGPAARRHGGVRRPALRGCRVGARAGSTASGRWSPSGRCRCASATAGWTSARPSSGSSRAASCSGWWTATSRCATCRAGDSLLSDVLAVKLGVVAGDTVTVEVLEGKRPVRRRRRGGGVSNDVLGSSATMSLPALHEMLGEGGTLSGAYLSVDAGSPPRSTASSSRRRR